MAKDFSNISAFVGKEVVVTKITQGSEEITGTISSVKDGIITLVQESRGSTYTYRVPQTELSYIKSDKAASFKEGNEVTIERNINKLTKIRGTIIGADANGVIIDRGEIRGRLTKTYIPFSKLENVDYGELTAEGKAKREKQSKRLKAARGDKSEKSSKKDKKAKLKLIKGGKKSKKAA